MSKVEFQGKTIDLKEVINNPSQFNIEDIVLEITPTDSSQDIIYKLLHSGLLITSCSADNPQLNEIVLEIAKKTTGSILRIKGPKITPELIRALSENDNLSKIVLAGSQDFSDNHYALTKEDYETFQKSSTPKKVITYKISPELSDIIDPIIDYNMKKDLILNFNYKNLQNLKEITISEPLSHEEIYNLKYISPKTKINFKIDNYQNLELILNRLLELNSKNEIVINVKDKENFNKTNIYINSDKYSKLNIMIPSKVEKSYYYPLYSLQEYKKFENILYMFIKPAIDRNYSPFEKYIYAYNIVKKFKAYQENKDDPIDSRDLYRILMNEFSVCLGYINIFENLLSKLGIPTIEKDVIVTTNKPTESLLNKEGNIDLIGHARAYSHIQDPKYGIDGFYISDPTWDNNIEQDFYNHLAITDKENDYSFRMHYTESEFNNYKDILFSSENKTDFYKRLERLIERKITTKLQNKQNIRTLSVNIYLDIIKEILEVIKELDPNKYKEIICKCKIPNNIFNYDIDSLNNQRITLEIKRIIETLCDYILSKINKPISGKTIITAAMVINKDVFNLTNEEAEEMKENLIEINRKRQEICFPSIKIENQTTGEINYQNLPNKFDSHEELTNYNKK